MEALNILWIITFFFFVLTLIYIWSKVVVISNKIKAVSSLIEMSEKIELGEPEVEAVETAESENNNEKS